MQVGVWLQLEESVDEVEARFRRLEHPRNAPWMNQPLQIDSELVQVLGILSFMGIAININEKDSRGVTTCSHM